MLSACANDPDPPCVPGDQRALAVWLRAVVEAKDIELAALRADLEAERELIRRPSASGGRSCAESGRPALDAAGPRGLGNPDCQTVPASWGVWARGSGGRGRG